MKRYIGRPDDSTGITGSVFVVDENGNESDLDPCLDLKNHSPTGFAWSYHGSGPAQLALALLCDATSDEVIALKFYQRFKDSMVATLSPGRWEMTQSLIQSWLREAAK